MFSLKEKEVNTGRQRELDLVKGFLMIMIVFIHSFQTIAGAAAAESSVHKIMFALFMPTGACLYLFTMGFGSVFTRHSQPKDMVRNGIKLLIYQGISNLCYAAVMTVSYIIRNSITGEVAGSREVFEASRYSMLTFVNIFFISGMCYLVLALYRKFNVKLGGYIISALIVGIVTPFTKLLVSDNQALNWLLDMTFGGKGETSFCFFPYLSYVFLGYVFAKVIRRVPEDEKGAFANRLNFETYNLGHLMMAGIVHRRATGKTTLFDAAVKATDFLCHFYETASAELARNAICPSHYMGVVEMYRATGNPRYLELSKNLIDIRGMVENGTDDNQDRIPFRDQYRAMGHAVRANYLYAGVADVYAETGEQQLMKNLTSIWNDIVTRKMYVTGACGALYDGTSPDGTCYEPDSIQKVHQSYGRPYQLPNSTAHNETCANIGNMLFNWRMLEVTGDAKYADLVETCLYNSVLSGISLDGKKYFYTNPLRISADLPYTLRWPKERTEYISCFCCPPNTLRTLCQAQNYAYTLSPEGIYCNLYGANTLTTTWKEKGEVALTQETDYPWDGNVRVTLDKVPRKVGTFSLFLRIPEWCEKATLRVNGQPLQVNAKANSYAEVNRAWKKGDIVELMMDMPVRLLEAHPLAEEIRNQVVVKRGPLVYCLESMDIANGEKIDNVLIPADIKLTPKKITIEGSPIVALEGMARLASATSWEGVLYRPVVQAEKTVNIRLIPYYAWGNRGKGEMTVWMPLAR